MMRRLWNLTNDYDAGKFRYLNHGGWEFWVGVTPRHWTLALSLGWYHRKPERLVDFLIRLGPFGAGASWDETFAINKKDD